ncbi:MAG: hypothetical protein JNK53_04670 [Phycisphaerae bacterium]|nr:hypothetical protein [Phycisphaerae bacterium]
MNQLAREQILSAANALFHKGRTEDIGRYFDANYVAHTTNQTMRDGQALIRSVVGLYRGAFKGFPGTGQPIVWREMVVSRFLGSLIAEEWVISELAERLLLGRKYLSRDSSQPTRSRSDA